jgi:hypothetical protein
MAEKLPTICEEKFLAIIKHLPSRPAPVAHYFSFTLARLLLLQLDLRHVLPAAGYLKSLLLHRRPDFSDHDLSSRARLVTVSRVRLPDLRQKIQERVEQPLLQNAFVMDRPHIALASLALLKPHKLSPRYAVISAYLWLLFATGVIAKCLPEGRLCSRPKARRSEVLKWQWLTGPPCLYHSR